MTALQNPVTWRHIPEDLNLKQCQCENLISCTTGVDNMHSVDLYVCAMHHMRLAHDISAIMLCLCGYNYSVLENLTKVALGMIFHCLIIVL
jgi:hypothetical protein